MDRTSRNPLRYAGFGLSSGCPSLPLRTAKNRSTLAPTGAKLAHGGVAIRQAALLGIGGTYVLQIELVRIDLVHIWWKD